MSPPLTRRCARCAGESSGTEWVHWPRLIGEHAVDIGWVCPGCLTDRDRSRLAMLRAEGEERTVLDFKAESPAAWGQS